MEISTIRYNKIKRIANEYAKRYNTRNAFIIFEKLHIPYSFISLTDDLAGFIDWGDNGRKPHVYINSNYDSYSQRIIAIHELGHLLLHQQDSLNMFNDTDYKSKEYEANVFAMEFRPYIQPRKSDYTYFSSNELNNYICSKLSKSK